MRHTPPSRPTATAGRILEKLGKLIRSVARKKGVPFQDFDDVAQRVGLELVRYPQNIPPSPPGPVSPPGRGGKTSAPLASRREPGARPSWRRLWVAATCLLCATIPWHTVTSIGAEVAAAAAAKSDGSVLQASASEPAPRAPEVVPAVAGTSAPADPPRPAPAVARDVARPSRDAPLPEDREMRGRDLAVAHACLVRAQQAADAGQTERAEQALSAYDAHAPDNPFAAARSAAARTLKASRASHDVPQAKADPRLAHEGAQR